MRLYTYIISVLIIILLSLPTFIFSQTTNNLQSFIPYAQAIFVYIIRIVFILALLFFLWGIAIFILNAGNEQKRAEGKQKMLWGIITLSIMFGVWGIVKTIQFAFFGSLFPVIPPPMRP